MAYKGFLIQDWLERKKAALTIPPVLSRSKSAVHHQRGNRNTTDCLLSYSCVTGNPTNHKIPKFSQILPVSLAGSVNQIWTICCVLTNLRGPLY